MKGTHDPDVGRGLLAWLIGWLTRRIDAIDRRVSARTDAPLLDRYAITKLPGGRPWTRTHRYRLSVWDLRHECELCLGSGHLGPRPCRRCAGTGVVTEAAVTEVGDRR